MNQHYPTWAQHPLMKDYYDHYWGRPVYGENELFEWLCLEIFQAGLAWRQVWQRRAAFEAAFANFEIEAVAAFTTADVDRLQNDSGIIRNRAKIQACCHNAQLLAQWHQAGRYLSPVAWAVTGGEVLRLLPDQASRLPATMPLATTFAKQLKAQGFQRTGPKTVFAWLCAVGIINGRLPE